MSNLANAVNLDTSIVYGCQRKKLLRDIRRLASSCPVRNVRLASIMGRWAVLRLATVYLFLATVLSRLRWCVVEQGVLVDDVGDVDRRGHAEMALEAEPDVE